MKRTMKFKIIAIVALIVIITIILSTTNISNAYSVGGTLTSSSKLIEGETVSVVLSFNNIDADSGVMSITVDKIIYDPAVFESITKSSFVGSNGWDVSYSTSNQILTLTNDEHITSSGAVVTLNLKVKDSISVDETSITFEKIVTSAGLTTGDIEVGTKTAKISKTANAVSTDGTPSTTTNSKTTTTTSGTTPSRTTSTATSAKQTSSAKSGVSTLPKTGVGMGIAISAVVVVIAGAVFYGLYRNLKKYNI